jgi:hypothetical protein
MTDKPIHILDQFAASQEKERNSYYEDQPFSQDFWTIRDALFTKGIGPNGVQIQKKIGGRHENDGGPGDLYNLLPGKMPLEDKIDFGVMQLYKSSRLTDAIGGILQSTGFCLSDKARAVFSKHNLGEHKYFPIQIEHKGVSYDYNWLHLKTNFNPNINFDKSIFFKNENMFSGEKTPIKFKSFEEIPLTIDKFFAEWQKTRGNLPRIDYKMIVLNKNIPDVAIFAFERLAGLYITKKLKDNIQSENLTGFVIEGQRRVFAGQ